MLSSLLSSDLLSASSQASVLLEAATRSPGAIVGPIANLLGIIYNILFNFIYAFIQPGSLGIAIILFTVFVKLVLFPLSYKQQKSTYKMQKLQPEMNKIKEKYSKKKDQESQQRMAVEMQEFQKKNGISLLGGCLPMLVQLPILYALFYIFQQAYLYVDVVGNNYEAITQVLMNVPVQLRVDVLYDIAMAHKMQMDLAVSSDVIRLVNQLTPADWNVVLEGLSDFGSQLTPLLTQKTQIEYFLGINLVYKAGLTFPGILIPIASAGSTWISSKMLTKGQNLSPDDPTASTMKTMNLMMPVMMGFMTITMPAGLGLYWTVSNLFQMFQQWTMQKYFKAKDEREAKEAA